MLEWGTDWFLMALEVCGGGTPDLGYVLEVYRFIGEVGVENKSGGPSRQPRGRGRAQGVGRALHPHGWLGTLLAQLCYSGGFCWSIKTHQKLACQLDSVWYSFSVKLKNKEKIETGTGL